MTVEQETLQQIVQRILSVASPERIILFGSAATGKMTPDSDIDLLIIEREIVDRQGEYVRIREALGDIPYPFDIILVSASWYETYKHYIGTIAFPASREGRELYAAA